MGELKLKTDKEKKKRHSETVKPRASRHWAMDWPGAEHKNAWILCAGAWQHESRKTFFRDFPPFQHHAFIVVTMTKFGAVAFVPHVC